MTPALAPVRLTADTACTLDPYSFPSWPHFSEDEIAAATEVLRSGRVNYWTGEHGRRFEQEFAATCGCKHGVAVANGTVALELALRSLGVGPGDDVIVPSRTFVASASCVAMCGARPVFADIDRDSQNITAATIEAALTPATRAIIAVHLAGWPCEMNSILELARRENLVVIEDCAQAQGATYDGKPVGSFGHAAAFSFCQDKIMTTGGEGGMLVTNDPNVFERAWTFKDHGKHYSSAHANGNGGGSRFVHRSVGTNWRMTEVQAVIGRRQLLKVPAWLEKRRNNANILAEHLSQLPALRIPIPPSHIDHAFYRFCAFVRPEMLKPDWNRDRILQALLSRGVPCSTGGSGELYLEHAFASSRPPERLAVARELAETSLAFLVHPTLGKADMELISEIASTVLQSATI
jgi:dTDP-4-amino-4,6-dideoxygalactose transaminase